MANGEKRKVGALGNLALTLGLAGGGATASLPPVTSALLPAGVVATALLTEGCSNHRFTPTRYYTDLVKNNREKFEQEQWVVIPMPDHQKQSIKLAIDTYVKNKAIDANKDAELTHKMKALRGTKKDIVDFKEFLKYQYFKDFFSQPDVVAAIQYHTLSIYNALIEQLGFTEAQAGGFVKRYEEEIINDFIEQLLEAHKKRILPQVASDYTDAPEVNKPSSQPAPTTTTPPPAANSGTAKPSELAQPIITSKAPEHRPSAPPSAAPAVPAASAPAPAQKPTPTPPVNSNKPYTADQIDFELFKLSVIKLNANALVAVHNERIELLQGGREEDDRGFNQFLKGLGYEAIGVGANIGLRNLPIRRGYFGGLFTPYQAAGQQMQRRAETLQKFDANRYNAIKDPKAIMNALTTDLAKLLREHQALIDGATDLDDTQKVSLKTQIASYIDDQSAIMKRKIAKFADEHKRAKIDIEGKFSKDNSQYIFTLSSQGKADYLKFRVQPPQYDVLNENGSYMPRLKDGMPTPEARKFFAAAIRRESVLPPRRDGGFLSHLTEPPDPSFRPSGRGA